MVFGCFCQCEVLTPDGGSVRLPPDCWCMLLTLGGISGLFVVTVIHTRWHAWFLHSPGLRLRESSIDGDTAAGQACVGEE